MDDQTIEYHIFHLQLNKLKLLKTNNKQSCIIGLTMFQDDDVRVLGIPSNETKGHRYVFI